MSHIVSIQTQVRDAAAVNAACQRLHLPPPISQTVKLFTSTATGLTVQLPDWRYPIVCQLATGELAYDNFNGRWGVPQKLDAFLQSYAVEKAKIESRKRGHAVTEQQLADGSIKLTINVGA